MEETGISVSVAAANIKKISKSMLSRWVSQLPVLMKVREEERENGRRQGSGRTSQLENVKDDILAFIEEYRLMGFAISKKMIVFQATRLEKDDGSSFSLNTYGARLQVVSRWMTQNRLTVRAGTHQAQADPEQTTSQALDFILNIARPAILPGLPSRDRWFILNMDQTPVFFSMHATRTVETVGKKTVNIRVVKNGSQRVTVAVCITAAGNQLQSLIIFKGKETDKGGKILNKELSSYPTAALYATQEKAWMSEHFMLLWVEKILKPYVATAPAGVMPLLFLDSYQVHNMASVNAAINDLGVEEIIIIIT